LLAGRIEKAAIQCGRLGRDFKFAGPFERVQLESRGLRDHSMAELEPRTGREKRPRWAGQRRWWASSCGCSVRGKLFSTGFHSGNLSFPRSIAEEQKCQ